MIHIGDCDMCPREGVRIVFGWTTRDQKHCQRCNQARLARKKKEGQKRVSAAYPKGTACFECGSTGKKLDRSHILSRGAHPELADDPENIVPHCRDCHQTWEFGDRKNMKTFALKRAYMEKHAIV